MDKVKQTSELFKALGDVTRLRIIRMLASNPGSTLCVADLASRLNMTAPAVSQHIKALKHVGLLEPDKQGFRVYYYINTDVLKEYKKDIDDLFELAFIKCPMEGCCRGHE